MGEAVAGLQCDWLGVHVWPSVPRPKLKAGKLSVINQVLASETDCYRGVCLFSWILLEIMSDFPQV